MLPNILTTVRLILVPVFAYFMLGAGEFHIAALIFILSGITDVVDGYIARHYNMITSFGKVYDPFVDKLMQITAIVCLVLVEIVPLWLLIVVCVKEISMIIAGGILYLNKIVVSSSWSGKVSTVIFYAGVLMMIVWREIPPLAETLVFAFMVAAMCLAACWYIIDTIRNYDKKRI